MFSEAEEKDIVEPVLDDDSEEERQKKERIPHRKADIARYCYCCKISNVLLVAV